MFKNSNSLPFDMEPNTIYEVKAPLWVKMCPLIICLLVIFAIWYEYPSSMTGFCEKDGMLPMVVFCVGFPFLFLSVLFTKTAFLETHIVHTNLFLQKKTKNYEDITGMKITRFSDLRLHFADGTSIKVSTGEGSLVKTARILRQFTDIKVTNEKSGIRAIWRG